MDAKRKLAIACRTSGVGDMLTQLAHVMWYAEATGRQCLVDWINVPFYVDPGADDIDLFDTFFTAENAESVAGHEPSAVRSGGMSAEVFELPVIEEFVLTGKDPGGRVVRFQLPMAILPPEIINRYFARIRLKDAITRSLAHTDEVLRSCIGVHVRHGNGELYDDEDEAVLFERYDKAIRQALERNRDAPVFLATDSVKVEQWFSQTFGAFLSNAKHLATTAGLPLHHPQSTAGNPAIQRAEIFADALRDMYALSQCRYLVCEAFGSFTRPPRAWGGFNDHPDRLLEVKTPRKPFLSRAYRVWL